MQLYANLNITFPDHDDPCINLVLADSYIIICIIHVASNGKTTYILYDRCNMTAIKSKYIYGHHSLQFKLQMHYCNNYISSKERLAMYTQEGCIVYDIGS